MKGNMIRTFDKPIHQCMLAFSDFLRRVIDPSGIEVMIEAIFQHDCALDGADRQREGPKFTPKPRIGISYPEFSLYFV